MTMYAFSPLDPLPPLPTAPGTDFQDLAAANLNDADTADASLLAAIAAAGLNLPADLADLADLGNVIVAAGVDLNAMIAEQEADDLLAQLAAAADQDSALASLGSDIGGAVLSLSPSLLTVLLSPLLSFVDSEIVSAFNIVLPPIWNAIDSIITWLEFIPLGSGAGPPMYEPPDT